MKKLALIVIFSAAWILLFSQQNLEIKNFFTADELAKINKGEIISRMFVKGNARAENSKENIEIPRTKYIDEDFNIYEVKTDEKCFIPFELNKESKLKFYNTLCSYSKLKEMNYYSRREGKIELLVKECYRVDSMSGNKKDDLVYGYIQPKISNMFLQKDNKFGTLIYRSDLYNEGDNFILVNTSLEAITALFLTLNNPEEYKVASYFIYSPEKKGFYMYSFLAMRLKSKAALKNKTFGPTGFSNRLRASTVHLAKLLGINWSDKYNAWKGIYDKY